MTKKRTPKAGPRDIAILHGPTEDGAGARLLRFRGDTVTAGEIRPAREGQPIGQAELVRLKPLHHQLPVCEVEVLHGSATQAPGDGTADGSESSAPTESTAQPPRHRAGPARVSNRRYRRNWSAVFGEKAASMHDDEPDYTVN
jgi:hypothetical protein